MNARTRQIILPLITAVIWGTAFVAQKTGSAVGTFTFTWTRYALAGLAVLAFLTLRARRGGETLGQMLRGTQRGALLRGGFVMGTLLMVATNLQQYGVKLTTAGKAGFITALYIVIVPLLGLLFGRRVRALIWCGVAIALAGLYLLSFTAGGAAAFSAGDVCILACALVFSLHILAIGHYTKEADGTALACLQFAVAASETLVPGLIFEGLPLQAIGAGVVPILYAGVISGGIGYTLQVIALEGGDPTVVSLLLSLEALFAVVGGALLLHERLSPREYLGCALMLCAVMLVQLPEKKKQAGAESAAPEQ